MDAGVLIALDRSDRRILVLLAALAKPGLGLRFRRVPWLRSSGIRNGRRAWLD